MRTIGMYLPGTAAEIRDVSGVRVTDDDFFVLLNSNHEPVDFKIPENLSELKWTVTLDTARPQLEADSETVQNKSYKLEGRSLAVLTHLQAQAAPTS
jgi:glycogen operon protein